MATAAGLRGMLDWRLGCLIAVLCTMLPGRAWAQTPFGAIDGVVRDGSGAILPGVTVELSSPAMIERVRSTVTDVTGAYQFLRLPVGTFSIRFSLTGFKTVVREDVTINASFTATVNANLEVGALEETVTVTGASPLVDIR